MTTTASYNKYLLRGLSEHCTFTIYQYEGAKTPGATLTCPVCERMIVLGVDQIWRALMPANELLAERELEGAASEQTGKVFDVVFDDAPDTVAPAIPVAQTQPRAPWGDTTLVREEDPNSGKHRNISAKPRPEQIPRTSGVVETEEVPETVH